jgi:hypothetical protein
MQDGMKLAKITDAQRLVTFLAEIGPKKRKRAHQFGAQVFYLLLTTVKEKKHEICKDGWSGLPTGPVVNCLWRKAC